MRYNDEHLEMIKEQKGILLCKGPPRGGALIGALKFVGRWLSLDTTL